MPQWWNLGFLRGFYDWKMNHVTDLYTRPENQRLDASAGGRKVKKPESKDKFSVKSYYEIKQKSGEEKTPYLWQFHIPPRTDFLEWEVW